MTVEERKEARGRIGTSLTLKDWREMSIDWDIADINEFLTTRGTRLRTKNHRLTRASDVRFILISLIEQGTMIDGEHFRIRATGLSCGEINWGMYHRERMRRIRKKRKEEMT